MGRRDLDWESRKPTAFFCSFTPKELSYFLFGKKRCPKCGGKLVRSKESFTTKGALPNTINTSSGATHIDTTKVRYYYYVYTCSACQARFSLRELAE